MINPVEGVDLKVTNVCNLKCSFCVNNDTPTRCGDVDTDKAIKALRQMICIDNSLIDLKNVFFTGGEPLIRLSLVKTIAQALPDSVFSGVTTNGLLMNSKILSELREVNIDRIKFSYDTVDSKKYALIRNGSGQNGLSVLEKNIKLAVKMNFVVFMRVAMGQMNYQEIEKIYKKANDLGVQMLQIKPIVASGRAAFNKGQLLLSHRRIYSALERLKPVVDSGTTKVSISCFPPAADIGFYTKACANKDKFYFHVNGDIYHCNYIMNPNNLLGNYYDDNGIEKAIQKRKRNISSIFNNEYVISDCPSRMNYK